MYPILSCSLFQVHRNIPNGLKYEKQNIYKKSDCCRLHLHMLYVYVVCISGSEIGEGILKY
jgi:hypothetical protein